MPVVGIAEYDAKRKQILIDGERYCLLYKGELRRLHLEAGEELEAGRLAQLDGELLLPRARSYAMHLLEKQERTKKQMEQKLREHCYPDHIAANAIAYWQERGYIDDAAYAERFLESRCRRYSYRVLKEKLLQRGIAADIIEQAWHNVAAAGAAQEDAPVCSVQEQLQREALHRVIEKKCRSLNPQKAGERDKLIRYLLGKGFPYSDIRKELGDMEELQSSRP